MDWTIKKILDWSTDYFQKKGVDAPRLNAELLLGKILGLGRVQLYVQFDRPLNDAELSAFKSLVQRRAAREPLAYILGEREFFSLRFEVSSATLIPRPETEELVERGLHHLKALALEAPAILDIATGSGCILISLLAQMPSAQGTAFDLQTEALAIAQRNAAALGVAERSSWFEQDLHRPWPEWATGPFDLITANLPYVPAADWEVLEPEVRDHEPKLALVPGLSGLEAFEAVLPQISPRLSERGLALLEIGMDQGNILLEMSHQIAGDLEARVHPDLSGRPRFLELGRHLPPAQA
ncbi:MAG: peptide chain release factor N(5)-glutamine methyltransferase [Deltaproteobacteria bacterium]|nr:peptide chain release factor N(5)-glutamine methyltransferase [Deltaproteobacteria bacterium]